METHLDDFVAPPLAAVVLDVHEEHASQRAVQLVTEEEDVVIAQQDLPELLDAGGGAGAGQGLGRESVALTHSMLQ